MTANEAFLDERRRTRRFFNRMSPLYPIVERHLFPQYRDVLARLSLPPELSVLDLATGTGLLASAFAERGHGVTGLDFADKLLNRARRRFPRVDFRNLDVWHLDGIETGAYDLVSMGYFLHGLSPEFRRFILWETARIARTRVLIFDYGRDGGWFIRFIEWIEGPNYPVFIAEDRAKELHKEGLRIDREERVSDFGSYWLCTPSSRRSASSAHSAREELAASE
jgi:ubiquinone/menaquinone biosynthesis C-methylase UbiE